MQDNQYFTLMHIPTYLSPDTDNSKVTNWQVRTWNYSEEKATVKKPVYIPGVDSFLQQLTAKMGASMQELLLDKSLNALIPAYMTLAATAVNASRGTKPIVGKENHITHYQVAFPKALHDLSFLLPVADENCGEILGQHLAAIEALLNQAAQHGEYPITYAVYVRYFNGTNGGLSSSKTTGDKQKILALEVVTHPNAPGYIAFENALVSYFAEQGIKPRYHLGKNMPHSVTSYKDFLDAEDIESFKHAAIKHYGSEEALESSPFFTPYFKQMLGSKQAMLLDVAPLTAPNSNARQGLSGEHLINDLLMTLEAAPPLDNQAYQEALKAFKQACSAQLEKTESAAVEPMLNY